LRGRNRENRSPVSVDKEESVFMLLGREKSVGNPEVVEEGRGGESSAALRGLGELEVVALFNEHTSLPAVHVEIDAFAFESFEEPPVEKNITAIHPDLRPRRPHIF
jgi:hypothetical protein